MSLYTTNFKTLVTYILPPLMRSNSLIAYISSSVFGLDTNMTDPNSVKAPSFNTWFADILIKATITSQLITLSKGLIYLTGVTGIYILNSTSTAVPLYMYNEAEAIHIYFYNESETPKTYIFNEGESSDPYNFYVYVPTGSYTTALGNQITSWVKLYKLAGKTFTISTY